MLTDLKLHSQADNLWKSSGRESLPIRKACRKSLRRGGAGRVTAGADGRVHAAGGGAV